MNTIETEIKLTKILDSEIDEVASVASNVYKRIIGGDHFTFIKNNIDTTHSIVARDGTEIIGGYILNEDVPFYSREDKFRNKKGIHGFALFLKEAYHSTGIGHQLRKYPETLGFDYIFGLAYKSLNNANHWRKFGRYVDGLLSGHNFFLLRGLTRNKIKHWYVVYSKKDDLTYNLLDPSNGVITISKDELDKIWKPREYDGFGFYR
jgi:hypothetical protein